MHSPVWIAAVCVAFLTFGTVQTVSMKWAFRLSAEDRFGVVHPFEHPFVNALIMFLAEFTCLPAHFAYTWHVRRRQRVAREKSTSRNGVGSGSRVGATPRSPLQESNTPACRGEAGGYWRLVTYWVRTCSAPPPSRTVSERLLLIPGEDVALPCNPVVFLAPSAADCAASVIQNVGLTLTYASVYQMLRGSTIVFIAALSYVWLGRRYNTSHLMGMGLVIVGLTFVGASAVFSGGSGGAAARNPLLGNLLIVAAQVLHAYQGVCEERLVTLYRVPPMQMVGMEGFYGVLMCVTLLAVMQLLPLQSTGMAFDDVILAFDQIVRCSSCAVTVFLIYIGGFVFNACQMTIIKHLSAATCVMLGSLRNVSVWMVCLTVPSMFNESLNALQLIGFLFLILGNLVFQSVHHKLLARVAPARAGTPTQVAGRGEELAPVADCCRGVEGAPSPWCRGEWGSEDVRIYDIESIPKG